MYECFNNPFPIDFGTPDLNLLPILTDYIPRPNKISWYNYDPLPNATYVASKNYVSNLNSPCDSPHVILLYSSATKTEHTMIRDKYDCNNVKRGYYSRGHDGIRCYNKLVYISPYIIFITGFINTVYLSEIIKWWVLDLLNINIVWPFGKLTDMFFSTLSITSFFFLFYSCYLETTLFQYFCILCLKFLSCIFVIISLNYIIKYLSEIFASLDIHACGRVFKNELFYAKKYPFGAWKRFLVKISYYLDISYFVKCSTLCKIFELNILKSIVIGTISSFRHIFLSCRYGKNYESV